MKKYKYTESFTYEGRRIKIRANTKKELAMKKQERLKELENDTKKIEKNISFYDWYEEWLNTYKRPTVSRESFDSYVSCINCHILPYIGNMQLKNIRAIHIQKIVNNMAGGSKKMINKVASLTFQILDDARKNCLIIDNPAADIIKPKGTVTSRRAITDTERKYILQVSEYHRAGTWILLMLYAGLRPAEAGALQWKNVDLKQRVIKIEAAIKRAGGVGKPKTASSIRKIPISNNLYDRLSKLTYDSPFEYVVKNTKGNMVSASSMRKMWLNFKKELNIAMGCDVFKGMPVPPYRVADDLVPYCMRHTFCTDLQRAGVPINVAKELMGHTDISITAKIYTHQTEEVFNNARNMMNQLQTGTPYGTPNLKTIEI